jgi:hypothetical protein
MNGQAHLNDEEMAAFVDGGLRTDARERAEEHLADCDDCRALMTAVRGNASPARLDRRVWVVSGLAAAAAIALLLIPRPPGREEGTRTRDIEAVGRPAVGFAADAPADGATVRTDTLTFRWTPAGGAATYQLTLSAESGAMIWTSQTEATALALPDSVGARLEAGRPYYWQVDAVLPNLRSASTGLRRVIPQSP